MQQMDIIIRQIIVLIMLALTGFISGKSGYLPKNSGVVLSGIVIKLTAPILIVTTMASYSFSYKMLFDAVTIYISGIVFLLTSFVISIFVSRRMKLEQTAASVYRMHSMFGNTVFLAFPLISSLYGEKGIIYAIFFNLASDTILWTLGIHLVNRHNNKHWKENLKHLFNANTVAFFIGGMVIVLNSMVGRYPVIIADIGGFVYNTFNPLGKTTIYMSMLFIGLILSGIKVGTLKDRYPQFILSLFKLVLIPAFALIVLTLLQRTIHLDNFAKTILILQLSMPCATIVPALASQYGSDYHFATENVFISTVLGIITLPLMVYLTL